MSDPVIEARANLARAVKLHGRDHEITEQARAAYREARLVSYVTATVDAAPPLSPETRARVAAILAGAPALDTANGPEVAA
ncbi:hypothetical protein [Actinosynnema pretiosum]|uniref:Uncharacterized protein n=1 Tax=Actinosynnema pretiosum TaxID=42197 RepID=A0A290YZB9_9PSEU|nr:hypothetical protein [Actinosynnema pretiosum]ATE52094.1 hypothetical protein CNX65_01320 [Actinosynnema pretiosum]